MTEEKSKTRKEIIKEGIDKYHQDQRNKADRELYKGKCPWCGHRLKVLFNTRSYCSNCEYKE